METLIIEATSSTPAVDINGTTGVFSISGKSYPENVNDFYDSIFDYIDKYKKNPCSKTVLEMNWIYYNTATSKIIVKLIQVLKAIKTDFEVNWYCKNDYELMIDKAEEIKEVLDVKLNIIYI